MSRWHNQYVDGHAHFCTATVLDWEWLLQGKAVRILYDEWDTARLVLDVRVLAYVVMPNHYHSVLWAEKGDSISRFLRRTQSKSAQRILPDGGLWKERPRVLPIYSRSVLETKVDYLHRNSLRKNLAVNPEDWEHSSFRQLVLGQQDVTYVCDDWGLISI